MKDISSIFGPYDAMSSWIDTLEFVSIEDEEDLEEGCLMTTKSNNSYFYEMNEDKFFRWANASSKGKWFWNELNQYGKKIR